MKWYYLTYRITIFGDSIWHVHLTHSISMMMLMRRHTKNGHGSAFSLKTRQIYLTHYVCWIPQHQSIMLMVHNAQDITTSESVRVCLCIYMCTYVYTYKWIFIYVYYIYVNIFVYLHIIYIYIYVYWFQWSCCELHDGSCKDYLCSESLFTLRSLLLCWICF